ncbi:MAG TPA: 50S ribosomal protein L17 [Firmicutes bacterium]|uniref:Large ribosomal subunit protein bL17 n=1 Tax=Capillibacterium thermochitinicola TaxID=2699427 RepID=A0A8J6LRV6_9FIRM|nr:50S ribosomal protein L17 [Capillibacterium thermochitinicola]MBA2132542.1 50S ribosomal protein L17 [Capillibacterium thermochitinicola]HHW11543.1 50S ribosomal protein L17 [Bacillota bacterium]
MNLRRLGRPAGHRKALFRNLVTELIRHEKITTTETKAKEIRALAEKMITLGKQGDLSARREVAKVIMDKAVVKKLFDEVATRYADRNGGYTRVVRIGPRRGDAAPMAVIELV